jgi:hypothetical protein
MNDREHLSFRLIPFASSCLAFRGMSFLRGRGGDLGRGEILRIVLLSSVVLLSSTRSLFHLPFVFYTFESAFSALPSGNMPNGVSCLPVSASEIVGSKRSKVTFSATFTFSLSPSRHCRVCSLR